ELLTVTRVVPTSWLGCVKRTTSPLLLPVPLAADPPSRSPTIRLPVMAGPPVSPRTSVPELTVQVPVPVLGADWLSTSVPSPPLLTALAPPAMMADTFRPGVVPLSATLKLVGVAVRVISPVPPVTNVAALETTGTVPPPAPVRRLALAGSVKLG